MLDASQLRMKTEEVKNLTKAKCTGGFLKTETRRSFNREDKYQLILLFDISQQELVVIANLNYPRQCWTVNRMFLRLC